MSLFGVGVDFNGKGAVVSSTAVAYTVAAASASLCVGYTYPLAAYLNFFPGDMISMLSSQRYRRGRGRGRGCGRFGLLLYREEVQVVF